MVVMHPEFRGCESDCSSGGGARRQTESLQGLMSKLRQQLTEEKIRSREMCHSSCTCLVEYSSVIALKNVEIEELNHYLQKATSMSGHDPISPF